MDYILMFLLFIVSCFLLIRRYTRRSDDVSSLQGPKPCSWVYGNMIEFILGIPAGQTEMGWFAKYGDVLKFFACFGEERLLLSDPAAIKHVLLDPRVFVKSRKYQLINLIGFGEGSVIYAEGADHRRIRGVMNTMFSAASVRTLTPVLERTAKDLSQVCELSSGSTVDIYRLLHQTTLRAITEAVMGYDITSDKEYTSTYEDLLVSVSQRSKKGIIADAFLSRLPSSCVQLLKDYPPTDLKKLLDHRKMTNKISENLIASQAKSIKDGNPLEDNLYSILLNSNAKASDKNKMSVDELKDQFGGLTTAGEDTTANSIVWILYVLSQHREWQDRLRREVKEADNAANTSGVDSIEYDRLPFLNAIIKEVLRFYPAGSFTEREAACDTTIPLSTPIISLSGKSLTNLSVNKGRRMIISMTAYNRLPSIWGHDANELNPLRWLDGREIESGGTIGPYANLSNFIGGPRTCLGWRFAILEIQVIVAELMRNFAFSLPPGVTICPASAITVVPMDSHGRTWLPLHVVHL
ncbi:hypothetical protein HYPSUDRAFT_39547 [Hypholoma sublateritium FD-334 SS-4]|uniref:Cytochrome P450 n=1 Tax=Hypholoma sublateritium (strain FD-334 SS-4) TaxID=945553 RepID=A0A0D2L954_HYPSF|nr:hypothetical protein HYPSUDRAFT_39547 [Hypholoma sublateritium FD-334 SS-4]